MTCNKLHNSGTELHDSHIGGFINKKCLCNCRDIHSTQKFNTGGTQNREVNYLIRLVIHTRF
jgi:hypothetical protein